jgi:hypothetical protein
MTDVNIDLASLTDEELRVLADGLIHVETNLAAAVELVDRLRLETERAAIGRADQRPTEPFTLALGLDPDADPERARHLDSLAQWLGTDLLNDPNTPPPVRMVFGTILRAVGHSVIADAASHELLKRPEADDIPPAER